jgi:hypothetical protein
VGRALGAVNPKVELSSKGESGLDPGSQAPMPSLVDSPMGVGEGGAETSSGPIPSASAVCTSSTRKSVSAQSVPMRSSSEVGIPFTSVSAYHLPPVFTEHELYTCAHFQTIPSSSPFSSSERPLTRWGGVAIPITHCHPDPTSPLPLTADLCRDKFSKCGVMAVSGLCQSVAASCARSCGGC